MGKRGQRVDGLQVNLTDGLMSLGLAARFIVCSFVFNIHQAKYLNAKNVIIV